MSFVSLPSDRDSKRFCDKTVAEQSSSLCCDTMEPLLKDTSEISTLLYYKEQFAMSQICFLNTNLPLK